MTTQAAYNTVSPSGSDVHWKVRSDTSPILIMSASQNERGYGSILNHSNSTLFLKHGSNVGMAVSGGAGIFDLKLTSGSRYELPKPTWQGEIWGAWDSDVAVGYALVLETGDND
jgi:hypothetical protein